MKKKELIVYKNASIYYSRNREILKEISITVSENDFVTILGPNGSGKTTLIKAIHGIANHSGQIMLDGKDIDKYSRKDIAKKVSYISQISDQFEGLKILDYIRMSRMPHYNLFNKNKNEDDEMILKLLDKFGLKHKSNDYMDDLSGGQIQIISIIAGIVQDSEILLIDEPTNHLDPKVVLKVFDILKELRDSGKTIILISHSINEAVSLANKVILIKEGKVFKHGKTTSVITKKNIDDLFEINSKVTKGIISGMKSI